jgi:X-X-X-Leu-X-X-Gly heptad repeat protein
VTTDNAAPARSSASLLGELHELPVQRTAGPDEAAERLTGGTERLTGGAERLTGGAERLTGGAERLTGAVAEAALARLEGRVRRLERLVGGSDDDAELETEDPELLALADDAELGQSLHAMLGPPRVREACEQTIEAWRQWRLRHGQLVERAVAASRVIATTRPDHDRHRAAAAEFGAAYAELTALAERGPRLERSAEHARAQLAHDDQLRDRYRGSTVDGDRAWALLIERLRARTSVALVRGDPLPQWLVDALGEPPAGALTAWRELGTQLLAYRITYRIGDPTRALGQPPGNDDSPRRRRWHHALVRRLGAWRVGPPR